MKTNETYLQAKNIELFLANTPQITFEVTDACNLNCTYCGYGQFYSDYDTRANKRLPVGQAIALLDYLSKLWNSPLNSSANQNVYISFYGGEPLLNMSFIQTVVDYVENKLHCPARHFTFSMTTNALLLQMQETFMKIYRNEEESLHQAEHYEEIERDMFLNLGTSKSASTYLLQYSDFVYKNYNELLLGKAKMTQTVPTGSCILFSKKIYVTVNGKILPCERIGHQFALGELTENGVKLDFEAIAQKYNQYYAKLDRQCKVCYNRRACIQCVYNLPDIDKAKVLCHGFISKANFDVYQSTQLAFLANNPGTYQRIMTEVIVK
ncbi:hypothetical protein FACS189451_04440 [Bacteroidia bacterium]|nr:hypothetical protein FACS189451_04440 [Bacteroidia bacterium]